jgi:hypothetical protein
MISPYGSSDFSTTENGSAGIVTPPVPVIVLAMHREL